MAMIKSFGNQSTQSLFYDFKSKKSQRFSLELKEAARRKLLYLHDSAKLKDLRVPPGNRLEALKGKLKGYHSIRINTQWRLVFRWERGNAFDVQIIDYYN